MKGKAAVFQKVGTPLEVVEFTVPEPEPGAIIIKIRRADICGSDVHFYQGEGILAGSGPWILGHEATGTVYRLGAGITSDSLGQPLKEGDRVVYRYFKTCGRCNACVRGNWLGCTNLFISSAEPAQPPYYFNGAFAEFFYLRPGMDVFKLPDEIPDEVAAPLNCALCQVTYGLHKAHIRLGDCVVIQGAGGLGVNAAAMAKEMGAGTVVVIDGENERLKLAESFGADFLIDINEYKKPRDRIARVRELVGGQGADIVLEVTGSAETFTEGINMVRTGGTYICMGNISLDKKVEMVPARIVVSSKKVVGVALYESWVIPVLLDYLRKNLNKYPYAKVLSHGFKLAEINEALDACRQKQVTRGYIEMD